MCPRVSARLLTIPISHYCEKARWALDRAGIPYAEERHLPFFHMLAARRAGGGETVPVLVTADGQVLGESAEIVRWADAGLCEDPEAEALERRLDEGLGPDGRLWMYHHTLPVLRRMKPWALAGVPGSERLAFRAGVYVLEPAMRRYLGVSASAAADALERCAGVFDEVAERLDGQPYLLGRRFSVADLTFAALAAPLILPVRYGSPLPPVEAVPEAMAREVRRFRAHPAGRFAERLYATERRIRSPLGS
jgi:glutathione S-transferase